ncbi:MAG: 2-oxoacid:acceptor oxidoreductase subunit alpha [Bacteroidia bacterium]|nr:2-oxoacid:acceptor oxidoreductase subunit alpha [Bacteroidia bacterium]MDW8347076.1 2-oxoacid:acceptor oxidoreductase subunit alpha [Bacteroidia bacterium]
MAKPVVLKDEVTIRFAGDSGDGMQLTGTEFTNASALLGNDLSTFPDYPAEIRAPQGTVAGVSGFQIHFGSTEVDTPGDICNVLVAMNAAALKANLRYLEVGGLIIANSDGFDEKNLRLAKMDKNPLEDGSLDKYNVIKIDITKIARNALQDSGLSTKEADRSKNMFVLGLLMWLYSRPLESAIRNLEAKFAKKPEILQANLRLLRAGYDYGETTELFTTRYDVKQAPTMEKGKYRNIMGNQALAYGFIAASELAGLPLYLGSYPITPASDILHELSKHKAYNVHTFQAEDEIAAICAAIGASFGGALAITTSSGPGIALKGEAIGLATMLELPIVIVNIQRGGPSTGLPTKTEQADLLQAMYGRNGECPVVVICTRQPNDCFDVAIEASRIAIEHMVPVMLLSDGYIANGAEPWLIPDITKYKKINPNFLTEPNGQNGKLLPYKRDDRFVRPWVLPGTKGLEHRIGGLEKQHETGNVSYDPENHEFMVKMRQAKVDKVADYIPLQEIEQGPESGELVVVGWGSTFGCIRTAIRELNNQGYSIAQIHLRYLNPFPKNLGEILKKYQKVLVPEINNGQLVKIIRDKFLVDAIPFNKIQGLPFNVVEMKAKILEVLGK